MIVDCHTHIWESPEQLGQAVLDIQGRLSGPHAMTHDAAFAFSDASADQHYRASKPVDKSLVLGFKSRYLNAEIPCKLVSDYVRRHPEKMIGVAGIDPTDLTSALEEMEQAHSEYGLKAITVAPAAQDFHPADSRAMQVYSVAARMKMPVFLHQGIHFSVGSKMEFARPALLDEVARDLPDLKLVIAHMGYPWIEECVVLLGKHPNIYADISSLIHRPWQAYNALLSAYQYGVFDKLLFGSDFPYTSAAVAIESLYRINQLVTGTNLPTIPRQFLASVVERDALTLLGFESDPVPFEHRASAPLLDAHEP